MDKKDKKLTVEDYNDFSDSDTRYYGVFIDKKGNNGKVRVDIDRFKKMVDNFNFSDEQRIIINASKEEYFTPAKMNYYDYQCNVAHDSIMRINKQWQNSFKPLINIGIDSIAKPKEEKLGDCENYTSGIYDEDEATVAVFMNNVISKHQYNVEVDLLKASCYSAFIHLFASNVEALTHRILHEDGNLKRENLYSQILENGKKVKDLPSQKYHDKLYLLWNFIKHNNKIPYDYLKDSYEELLIDPNVEYNSGELALFYINFSDELIEELLQGVDKFFIEFCEAKFGENYSEAQWNYSKKFIDAVKEKIEDITNPLDLSPFI